MTFYSIIGAIAVILLAVAIAASAIAWAYSEINKTRWDRWMEKRQKAAREIGQEIISAAYWFSENPAAYSALSLLGKELQAYGGFDSNKLRQEWRSSLLKPLCSESQDKKAG